MCTKWIVHIFNVWTIIMSSMNIKAWLLLELQITQTRNPPSISDEKISKFNTPQKWKKEEVHIFNMWTIIRQSLNEKE